MAPKELIRDEDYRVLAEFRYQLRRSCVSASKRRGRPGWVKAAEDR
jgi:hypothetical protein